LTSCCTGATAARKPGACLAERELRAGLDLAQDEALHDRAADQLGVAGDGHGDAGLLLDRGVLAQQHLEHDAVDGVVAPVERQRPDRLARLPVAIDPALALLVARRVPGEVVVHDRAHVILQVDALGQTVGTHQHPARRRPELGDPGLAVLGRQRAIDRGDRGVLELLAQVVGDVGDRRDEPAEHDRRVAVGEQLVDELRQPRQLAIVLADQRLGVARQLEQPAGVGRGVVVGRAGRHVERVGALVVEVEDGAPALVLDGRGVAQVVAGPGAQGRDRGGRGRRDRAQERERRPPADAVALRVGEVSARVFWQKSTTRLMNCS
jgi:hypothetical protein